MPAMDKKIGDEVMRRLGIGAGKRREHALIFRRSVCASERQFIEIVRQRPLSVEILDQAALPRRRQIERGDKSGKQPDIADADFRRGHAINRGGFEAEREHFGVGRRLVVAAEGFDAGLQEFRGRSFAMAEHRAEVTKARCLAGGRRLQIGARNRDGEVGPQAQFAPERVAGEKHAAADILAREIEERLRRLHDRGLDQRIAGAHVGRDKRLRAQVRTVGRQARHNGLIRPGLWLIHCLNAQR